MTDIEIPVTFTIEINEDDFRNFIENHPRFAPVVFGYTAKHSVYIEYGTGPAAGHAKYWIGKEGRKAILAWVKRKLNLPDKEAGSVAQSIIYKIQAHGITPNPFWRPALHQGMANIQAYYDKGYDLWDVGNEIGRIADRNMITADIPDTGAIQRSWYIDLITANDPMRKEDLGNMAEEVWAV